MVKMASNREPISIFGQRGVTYPGYDGKAHEPNINYLYGGADADGTGDGHGHIVTNTDHSVTYWREPGSDHNDYQMDRNEDDHTRW